MADADMVRSRLLSAIKEWYEAERQGTGKVNQNVMAVGLIITEHMAQGVPIPKAAYRGETQVKGISGSRIRKILARHHEERSFLSEGGRTSRGSLKLAENLVGVISVAAKEAGYPSLSLSEQEDVRNELQAWFVQRVREDFFDQQRIAAQISPSSAVRVSIAAIIEAARSKGGNSAGAVLQHLVGAKLTLRFPNMQVDNYGYTTADQNLDRPGDFCVGDTAIHVTTAPGDPLFKKCAENIADGFRPMVLVPSDRLDAARQLADNSGLAEETSVQSVEDFVGTNVEETALFESAAIRKQLRSLLEIYNKRVAAIESNPALLMTIPKNL